MNDSRVETLLEKLQDGNLNEDECRELMQWFDRG